jgi:hypothetical protein
MIEVADTSEMSVNFCQTTRCSNSERSHIVAQLLLKLIPVLKKRKRFYLEWLYKFLFRYIVL